MGKGEEQSGKRIPRGNMARSDAKCLQTLIRSSTAAVWGRGDRAFVGGCPCHIDQ